MSNFGPIKKCIISSDPHLQGADDFSYTETVKI